MQQNVFGRIGDARLRGYVVWLPRYPRDSVQVARRSVAFLPDERVTHFWDGAGELGETFGRVVKLPLSKTFAWDVYFLYNGSRTWGAPAPKPDEWMHQLGQDARRLDAEALATRVRELLRAK